MYNIGDIVRISSGTFQGKLGIVKNIGSDKVYVRFAKSDSALVIMSFGLDQLSYVDAS